jgi:transposase-like protein
MYRDRVRDHDESKLQVRQYVGTLLDINPATMRKWIEREEIDSGERSVTTVEAGKVKALRKENAELRRANETLKIASAFFAQAELDRRLKSSWPTSTPQGALRA